MCWVCVKSDLQSESNKLYDVINFEDDEDNEDDVNCSANAEAMGSNPVEAQKIFFGVKFAIA